MATTKITSPELFDLGSLNTALKLPSGTTAQRPTSPSTGEWRYNTTTNLVEFWDGGAWRDLQSENIPPINSEHFNVVLYTGNGSTQSITGVGFQPDFVWVKARDRAGEWHMLSDSTRGTNSQLFSNAQNPQDTKSTVITSFDSDGFTVGSDNLVNFSGDDYVAWCWKAGGGTTSSNTDGSITSTVQANTKAGFSIVKWTGTGAQGTIGHGLSAAPELIFSKRLDSANNWNVYQKDLSLSHSTYPDWLYLNLDSSQQNSGSSANHPYYQAPSSTLIYQNTGTSESSNVNGGEYISYCFASVAGYSKIGSYTGNGLTNGPIVNTGFEPAYVMIKRTDSIDDWIVVDNKRNTVNSRYNYLMPNSDAVENGSASGTVNPLVNFLTNGFQIAATWGAVNNNGSPYIYIAFASDASTAPALPDSFTNKLYTGNGAQRNIETGFKPGMVWWKSIASGDHNIGDVVQGAGNFIRPNSTIAQYAAVDQILSYNDTSYTIGTGNDGNQNGYDFVSWTWKANIIPTINTDGTIQSLVSANQAAGFSIVKYTGTGANATVGHGLSSAPNCIITKRLDAIEGWLVWFSSLPASNYMYLNSSGIGGTDTNAYKTISSTTNQIGSDGTVNASGGEYISYVFHSVSGFSKMGTYTGTGATHAITGVGFQPDWIMGKETDGVDSWEMVDSARGINKMVYANGNNAEVTNTNFTSFDSDGFTLSSATSINQSGQTYIYMAFKENPTPRPLAGNMSFLVVAGGGGGGYWMGGGAGAGGFRTSYGSTSGGGASSESDITLASGTYTITVGAAGTGMPSGGTTLPSAGNGGDSSIAASGLTTITSIGGGGGGAYAILQPSSAVASGANGGSGGGAWSISNQGQSAGTGTANQGYAGALGGNYTAAYGEGAGGGGGAAGAGTQGVNGARPNGGAGLSVSITGSAVDYAGGGGGATTCASPNNATNGGLGGAGGGGNGGYCSAGNDDGGNGTTNTGGGGGGSSAVGTPASSGGTAGNGGSGVVVLRLLTSEYSSSTTGSPTVTTDGDYTVLTYTGSGTYVHS